MYWMKVNLGEPQWGKIIFEDILSFHIRGGGNREQGHCVLKWVLADIFGKM